MNLKEAFRYKHKIEELVSQACVIISDARNHIETKTVTMCSQVADQPDKVTIKDHGKWFGQTENIAMFACELLKQKEALCEAIREAKISQKFDAGLMSDVNATRRTVATVLQTLSSYEENTSVLEDEGRVWMVNNEGTQVPYQCDKRITETPTFDKDLIKGLVDKTFAEADTASSRVDLAMVEDCVRWNPSFSVNESFKDVYRKYVRSAGL